MMKIFALGSLWIMVINLCFGCKEQTNSKDPLSYSYYKEDSLKFEARQWLVSSEEQKVGENDRHYMLMDLLDNHLKIGMDSNSVKKALGEPERNFGFSYNMGIYISGLDPTFLILDFDSEGKLSKISIETI